MHSTVTPFADAVLENRMRQRLTQAELGDRLGVGQQTIHRWETGQTSPQHRVKEGLAEFLELSRGDLDRLVHAGPDLASGHSSPDAHRAHDPILAETIRRYCKGEIVDATLLRAAARESGVHLVGDSSTAEPVGNGPEPKGDDGLRTRFETLIDHGISGVPVLEPRQDDLVEALVHRIRSGSPLSEGDAEAVRFVRSVLQFSSDV